MSTTDDYGQTDSGTYSKADQYRRRLAEALLAQASSAEPIASGWQGAAKIAQALVGGLGYARAGRDEERQRQALVQSIYAASGMLDGGGAVPDAGPATTGSISGGGGGGGIGSDYAASMTPEEAIVRTVAGEAAGEPAEGQAAVASVILNRAKQSGQSPQQVVLAKNQFEPWSRNPQQLMALTRDSPKYQQILANIQPAMQGQDVTGGATHFYAPRAQAALGRNTPAWARGPYQDIGNHRFFKLAGGPTGQTAALPGVVPVGSAPTPDVAAFLGQGTGTRPTVPGGPAEMMTPAPIGRGAVVQPVPGTPMPTRPTVTGHLNVPGVPGPSLPSNDPMVQPSAVSPPDALGRTTPGATGPVAMPQPIPQGGHTLMAQQPPAPLGKGMSIGPYGGQIAEAEAAPPAQAPVLAQQQQDPRTRAIQAVVQAQGRTDAPSPYSAEPPNLPRARPVAPLPSMPPGQLLRAPIQPPAAPVARNPAPRPAQAVASPVVPSAAGPATTAAVPQQRGQIFREPAMSAQEFARQGQNYLTGRPSFADQQRVAPRTMQEPVAGMAGGAPAGSPAAAPVSPRQGLIQRLFGGGGGGGAAAAQGAPAGFPVAGAGQPVDARRMAIARLIASGRMPAPILAQILKRQNPEPPDPYTLSPGQVRYGPGGQVLSSVPAAPEKPERPPASVQEYEYAKGQGFKGTYEQWEASKKGGMSLVVNPETGEVTFQQGANIKPLTEAQSKDTVYATRAEGALTNLDKMDEQLTSLAGAAAGGAGPLGNYLKSPEYQQAEQAGQEFLTAILRKDTGAAITKGELDTYGATYLPGPGDGPGVVAQKKQSRARALAALKAGMTPQAILNQEVALRKTATTGPKPGDVEDGYRFKGGDPADRNNWEPVS